MSLFSVANDLVLLRHMYKGTDAPVFCLGNDTFHFAGYRWRNCPYADDSIGELSLESLRVHGGHPDLQTCAIQNSLSKKAIEARRAWA